MKNRKKGTLPLKPKGSESIDFVIVGGNNCEPRVYEPDYLLSSYLAHGLCESSLLISQYPEFS